MKTLLLVVFPFFYFVNAQVSNEIIWNKDLKLKKEDFTLVEYDSLLLKRNPFGATSAIKIEFDERSENFVAKFLKSESILSSYFTNYAEPESLISILNHEQGHFDIAQIFAQKMNLMYLEKRFVKNKNQIQEIYNIVYNRYSKVDEKYDKETEHNMNKEKQKYWDNSFKSEIGKLNDAIIRIDRKKSKSNDMDYYKKYGNYYEKTMITGNHLEFVIVETEEAYKEILKNEPAVKEIALSKDYGTDIHSLENSYLAIVDAHRQYAFFIPKDKSLLTDVLRHLTIFIKKGENNYVMFENYWIYEFESILLKYFNIEELELVKVHKNSLSKLYYSKKVDKYLLIDCDRIDLKSKAIKPGNVFIFDSVEDVKKARFYEDS